MVTSCYISKWFVIEEFLDCFHPSRVDLVIRTTMKFRLVDWSIRRISRQFFISTRSSIHVTKLTNVSMRINEVISHEISVCQAEKWRHCDTCDCQLNMQNMPSNSCRYWTGGFRISTELPSGKHVHNYGKNTMFHE